MYATGVGDTVHELALSSHDIVIAATEVVPNLMCQSLGDLAAGVIFKDAVICECSGIC